MKDRKRIRCCICEASADLMVSYQRSLLCLPCFVRRWPAVAKQVASYLREKGLWSS
jgi:hypothetical protein